MFLIVLVSSLNSLQGKRQILEQLKIETADAIDQPWKLELAIMQSQIDKLMEQNKLLSNYGYQEQHINNGIIVYLSLNGDDHNDGKTVSLPMKLIKEAIYKYGGQHSLELRLADGIYNEPMGTSINSVATLLYIRGMTEASKVILNTDNLIFYLITSVRLVNLTINSNNALNNAAIRLSFNGSALVDKCIINAAVDQVAIAGYQSYLQVANTTIQNQNKTGTSVYLNGAYLGLNYTNLKNANFGPDVNHTSTAVTYQVTYTDTVTPKRSRNGGKIEER